ncbi:MAG: 3-hydroxyacyl-[acyl-carrier-protein] dehydratase FabZ [Ilumatobacteraceae bacterium]
MNGFPAPADVLPHRPPFLFVDEITGFGGPIGQRPVAPDRRRWFFAGRFPDGERFGVLMCEGHRQVGALAVLLDERYAAKARCSVETRQRDSAPSLRAGDTWELSVELGRCRLAPA